MSRGRFAPSPTGELHLGSARTALIAWLAARAASSEFILRLEDLDVPRVMPGAAEAIMRDLRWLGLDWDEGPDVGGPHGPYVQSQRTDRYAAAVERLRDQGRLFPCFCSRADVARLASAPHGLVEEGPRYPGTCRPPAAAGNSEPLPGGRYPSLRFRVERGEVSFVDAVAGHFCQDVAQTFGDFVVRRADGIFAYQLAVVVDDVEMRVEQVVRGADLLSSTPRQLLLYRAFAAPPPSFAHVPLVLGPDGQRLSKRHGSISVRAFREAGRRAQWLTGRLAASLGLCDENDEMEPRELIGGFSLARIRDEKFLRL